MKKKIAALLCACVMLSGVPCLSVAGDFFGKAPEGEVSVIDYGFSGMGMGLCSGLAAGYIRYKDDNDNAKDLLMSAGYGTLLGAGLGLILGTVDASNGKKGIGARILRNMDKGGTFGLLIGSIWGGLNALNKSDVKYLGEGAAWGYLGGELFGAVISFIEMPKSSSKAGIDRNFNGSVVLLRDSDNNAYPAFAASYSF